MQSAGFRERLKEDERKRITREAREAAEAEMAERVQGAISEAGLDDTMAAEMRRKLLGVKS